jgi:hypothetical protein
MCFIFSTSILAEIKQDSAKEPKAKESKTKAETEEPPKIGNFSLPGSQQPGPLISFGEHVIDKKQSQLYFYADLYSDNKKHMVDLVPGILYGITDNISAFLNIPIAASFRQNDQHSAGLEDIYLELEYAFYNKKTTSFQDQATLVGNIDFPTGSANKQPPTGFGAMSFFLGGTFNRTYVDWLFFTSHGVLLTTTSDNTKFGNQFLYELGFGRNIDSVASKWIFDWIVEVDGQYSSKNKIHGVTDPNSGGNFVYVTPSLWISTQKFVFQLGIGWPITQHLNGIQNREKYLVAFNLGYTL